jgi:CRISPR-associated protein (TIGR02710 family)
MSVAIALSAVFHECACFRYTSGVRMNGVVINNGEKFTSIGPAAVLSSLRLRTAENLILNFRFDAARTVLSEMNEQILDKDAQELRKALESTALAYAAWDRFDYRRFEREYQRIGFGQANLEQFRLKDDALAEEVAHIGEALEQGEIVPELMADLHNNAFRRLQEAKYDDSLSRLYRLTEMLAQFALRQDFSIMTSNIDPNRLPEGLRPEWEAKRDETGKLKIGLEQDYILLEQLGHPLGKYFMENSQLRSYLGERNQSFLAHGVKPISEKIVQKLMGQVEQLCTMQLKDFTALCGRLTFPWQAA